MPSEFGIDPARMGNAIEPGRVTFDDKMAVRKAIEEAGIPHTYVSSNCFAGYFLGGLCQPGLILPPMDSVRLFGDGNQKGNSFFFISVFYLFSNAYYVFFLSKNIEKFTF